MQQAPLLTLTPTGGRNASPSIRATAFVFEDPRSRLLRRELEQLAPSEASVVIIGETGTGKELVARYVHEQSKRVGPFIAVNCGALTETLVEAELFGYEKGAFTGAIQSQLGWFESANGGTLFLDEIGDLPLHLQVKLLRVLQEREVVRLGSRRSIPVNVRVIAATNVDLDAAVAAGRFREDLFFRLNVAPVHLPALRERPGDILPLANHFLGTYSQRLERAKLKLSPAAERQLLQYVFPGNIRELENIVHYAVLVARGDAIAPEDLRLTAPRLDRSGASEDATLEEQVRALTARHSGTASLFERVTDSLVLSVFEANDRNQVRTAAVLGVSRNTLRTHLARLGLIDSRRAAAPKASVAGTAVATNS